MFGLMNWLRKSVRNAVLGGVQDALDEIQAAKEDGDGRLLLTYGGAEEPEPAKKVAKR